jgi:RNA polymerase sigma factor (sigma-70 family)
MRDSEVVASIVAGEPAGLAAAYDRYAADLFGYCRSLLSEPDDAADAVQDTFVIAASKLAGLREPDRLRSWLFAVARNECLRRLRSRQAAAPLQDAPEPADESADVGVAAERAETVALVRAAVAGLNDGERDVINQLWHGLDVPEAADVLGVSRTYAYTLFSRAREQLAASVAVLLVGRSGRRDCAALDSLLGDWDGALTARLRRRVVRHIDQCLVCSDRRRRELTPAMLALG